MSSNEYEFRLENPIWIEFTNIPVGESLSKYIIFIGGNEKETKLIYTNNEPDFYVHPRKFSISKNVKRKVRLTWTRSSEDRLKTTLRFKCTGSESTFYYIICETTKDLPIPPSKQELIEIQPALSFDEELKKLEDLVNLLPR